jgi:hypothetical protein
MYVAQNNKKDEIKSFVITVMIHALLFLLIWFYKVWTQPDPPTPGMPGIEINFGFTDAGSGDNNTTEQVSEASAQSITQPVETAVTTSELPNEHVVQEQQNTTTVTQQTQTTTTQTTTNNTSRNTMQTNAKSGDGTTNQSGNQGSQTGSVDSRNYFGNGGKGNGGDGQGGVGLDMNGWKWVAPPKPQDNSNETGKIVFQIKVNEDGEVIDVVKLESSVSDAVVKKYKEAVERLEFEKIAGNNSVAPISKGTVTFIIKKN